MHRIVIFIFFFFTIGCAVFVKNRTSTEVGKALKSKVVLDIDNIVYNFDGTYFHQLNSGVLDFANSKIKGCKMDCPDELFIKVRFYAEANSKNSSVFKIWEWVGILTFGIIPVVEKTQYTLIADINSSKFKNTFKRDSNQYLVLSIFLLPFNIFRNWREDVLLSQKTLLSNLYSELIQDDF